MNCKSKFNPDPISTITNYEPMTSNHFKMGTEEDRPQENEVLFVSNFATLLVAMALAKLLTLKCTFCRYYYYLG